MNRIRSACVRTNSSKNCFVSLSGDLAEAIGLRIQGQPFALQLQWENGKAFASWSGEVARGKRGDILNDSSSIVQLGKKFADGLGLDDKQQVLVEPVVGIPSCNRINVDPVSANDWEILELHAGYIESQLLNQVRVVFPGQILPIWIENNMCVVVQIVNLEPDANCVRLDEFTEVIVSPKTRTFSKGKQPQQAPVHFGKENTEQGKKMHTGTSAENKYASTSNVSCFDDGDELSSWPSPSRTTNAEEQNGIANSGFLSRVSCYLQSFFDPCDEENPVNENQTCKPLNPEEIKKEENWKPLSSITEKGEKCDTDSGDDSDFEMYLRVQPNIKGDPEVSNKGSTVESMNFYSQQPTTVFVDITSLPPLVLRSWTCNWETFPPPNGTVEKTVQIHKLLSPKERTALQKTRSPSNSNENQGSQSQETSTDSESNQVTGQSPPDSTSLDMLPPHWVVRMVMTSSLNRASVDPNSHELGVEEHVLPGHVILTKELCKMLGARDLCLVKIQNVSSGPSDLQGMVLHPFPETEQKLQDISADTVMDAFQGWISMVCSVEVPLVLCSGTLLSFDAQGQLCQFVVKVLSHQETMKSGGEPSYYHLTPETLNNVTVVIGTPQNSLKGFCEFISAQEIKPQFPKYSINDLGGVTDVFHKCLDHALSVLGQRPLSNQLGGNIISGLCGGAVLICGSGTGAGIGCGKTSLARAVCYQLQEWPVCAHVTLVDCIPFRGKRVDTIQKQWQQLFLEAAWHQPSVILFDDLDQVVSAPSALQEMGGEALYKRRLAQVFKDLISTEINNNSRIVVIATSKSYDSLHPSLLTSRGCHVFQCRAELHSPDADQRQQILSAMMAKLFRHRDCDKLELSLLAKKTEGFSPRELQSLLDRALHKAAVRKMTTSAADGGICSAITPEDFEKAFEGFTPAALRGVSLHTAGELGWSDVGGLSGVKAALMETLLWPTKYSWLFSKCPLRLRSGLLLYGPPGTGKTLLAGVVAKECGLNFISIKGPELLSKYIGASEQAVRDMFTRAQSAKPCILFFDEFDSLAPRRGHDSTGVTDRVVNQLLTQLDGVEGLDGVYILAATSRPDLIDPALLRPGRLDKCLFCGIPTKSERLQILEALSRSVTLSEDINLAVISDMCEHFTGADFKALLYNAQLAAIHRNANNSQLYKAMFKNTEMESTENYDRCAETDVVTEEDRDSVIYVPSLTEGSIQLSTEELTKLHSEVTTLHKNLQHRKSKRKALQSNSAENEVTFGIQINQSDLFQAASAAGPSVSDSERRRYQAIYETFVKSRGDFSLNTPGHGKATLA